MTREDIEKIEKQIHEHSEEISKLYDILQHEKVKKFHDKIALKKKCYKFRVDNTTYYGVITSFWYSGADDRYFVNYCGFYGEFLNTPDANYFTYDAHQQLTVFSDDLDGFINSFVEISEEDMEREIKSMFTTTLSELGKWVGYYQTDSR